MYEICLTKKSLKLLFHVKIRLKKTFAILLHILVVCVMYTWINIEEKKVTVRLLDRNLGHICLMNMWYLLNILDASV